MPTARERVEITEDVEIEFQMWCSVCGNGICKNTIYKKGTVNEFETYCDKCLKEKENLEKERDVLESNIEDLNKYIMDLEEQIKELEGYISKLQKDL